MDKGIPVVLEHGREHFVSVSALIGMNEIMIELDGSMGEGGGQILRSSLSLSLLTGKAFHLRNIRAGRAKPGLQPQHLMCVRAAAEIGQVQLNGATQGSTDLVFEPGTVSAGKYHFAIGTAGATGLVLQTVYLPLALRGDNPSEIHISGGTHVKAAPCFHFLDTTWRSYLEAMDLPVQLKMLHPGFYPRGGGLIHALIHPCSQVRALHLTKPSVLSTITGLSAVAGLPVEIAERQARQAIQRLQGATRGIHLEFTEEKWERGPGTVLALTVDTAPAPAMFFALGERGKRAERVADEAVDELLAFMKSPKPIVDPHSADQIILPLAFAKDSSTYATSQITRHLLTNIRVIQAFLDRKITCEGEEGQPGLVHIE